MGDDLFQFQTMTTKHGRGRLFGSFFCLLVAPLMAQGPPAPVGTTLLLDQAITEAVANNLDLAAERYNVSVAQAREITAGLKPNPVVTMYGSTLNLLHANFSPATPLGPNQFDAHADFILERAGKRERRVELAQADRSLTEFGVR